MILQQIRHEVKMSLRNGEQVLVSIIIPVLFLIFFSSVDVLPLPEGVSDSIDFLAPGILALAVMSSAMVSLGIGTGFERQYLVLKRLGATPLGRPRWVSAKIAMICCLLALQIVVLVIVALLLGWSPQSNYFTALIAILLGASAFAGLGLLMAGTLKGTVTLAAANGLYLVLLLIGGMIVPFAEMPSALATIGEYTPAGALSTTLNAALRTGATSSSSAWVALVIWAIATPVLAARFFRWE